MRRIKRWWRRLLLRRKTYCLVQRRDKYNEIQLLYAFADFNEEEAIDRNTHLVQRDLDVEWIYWGN